MWPNIYSRKAMKFGVDFRSRPSESTAGERAIDYCYMHGLFWRRAAGGSSHGYRHPNSWPCGALWATLASRRPRGRYHIQCTCIDLGAGLARGRGTFVRACTLSVATKKIETRSVCRAMKCDTTRQNFCPRRSGSPWGRFSNFFLMPWSVCADSAVADMDKSGAFARCQPFCCRSAG
jgi:hypothetical protein